MSNQTGKISSLLDISKDIPGQTSPSKISPIPKWIHDRNPFFLLSGPLMLAGCFTVTKAVHEADEVPLVPLLATIGLFHLYNALCLILALYYAKKRRLRRDAAVLLGVPLLLMGDGCLLHTELQMADPALGAWVSLLAVIWVMAWLGILFQGLGVHFAWPSWTAIGLGVAACFGLPQLAYQIAGERPLGPAEGYGLVWLATAIAFGLLLARRHDIRCESSLFTFAKNTATGVRLALAGLVLLHTASVFHVFLSTVALAYFAPPLLAIAVLIAMRFPISLKRQIAIVWLGCIAAALSTPVTLQASHGTADDLTIIIANITATPFRGSLLLVALMLAATWRPRLGLLGIAAPTSLAAIAFCGPTPLEAWQTSRNSIPNSAMGWGVSIVGLSFVCLALGVWHGRIHADSQQTNPPEWEPIGEA